jgi:hypothetical protein
LDPWHHASLHRARKHEGGLSRLPLRCPC